MNALTLGERRELFLKVAAKLFDRKGYNNTSVDDITGELGFTKKVFYYYWKNKNEVLQEIHNRGLRVMHEHLDEVIAKGGSPATRLELAISTHVETVLRDRSIIAVLLGDFDFSKETLEGRRAYTRRFQDLVEEGIAAGVVVDLDPHMLTYAILGLCNSIARWYRPDGRLSGEEIRDIFTSFSTEGWRASRSGDGAEDAPGPGENALGSGPVSCNRNP
ncbi:MAG TPA: TetR/AcrR family transcriptional regulator [Rubrobacter sp.]|nr:TetR/AcrR family transcriptional regulator [Rubrobacter sp.]